MPRRNRCLLRERWRADLKRGLAPAKPLRPRSRLWADRVLQRRRAYSAELCCGDDVSDPSTKPADQGLHQHGIRASALSGPPLGDNPAGSLRTHSLPGACCRGLGSGPAGVHRHARGAQLWENACTSLVTESPAGRHQDWPKTRRSSDDLAENVVLAIFGECRS